MVFAERRQICYTEVCVIAHDEPLFVGTSLAHLFFQLGSEFGDFGCFFPGFSPVQYVSPALNVLYSNKPLSLTPHRTHKMLTPVKMLVTFIEI